MPMNCCVHNYILFYVFSNFFCARFCETYSIFYLCITLGFNCGEAVNFAIGDWFPLGALASQRYALLNRTPLLPQEELLCKEAMLIFERVSSPSTDLQHLSTDATERCIMVSFAQLMRFQHRARWLLMKSKACVSFSPTSEGALCSICKRDCYVAYIKCSCYRQTICLRHGICICHCFTVTSVCSSVLCLSVIDLSFS